MILDYGMTSPQEMEISQDWNIQCIHSGDMTGFHWVIQWKWNAKCKIVES